MSGCRLAGFQLTVPSFMWNRRLKLIPSSLPIAAEARAGASFLFASATLFAISSGSFSVYRRPRSEVAPTSSSRADSRARTGPVWVWVAQSMTCAPGMPGRCLDLPAGLGHDVPRQRDQVADDQGGLRVADFQDDGLGVDVVEDGLRCRAGVVPGERSALRRGDDDRGGPDLQVGGEDRGGEEEERQSGKRMADVQV